MEFQGMIADMNAARAFAAAMSSKPRKTNFTAREVEALLASVRRHRDTVLWGVAGGRGWARAWGDVAAAVSAVEGLPRSEGDVRKKWTYLKWEAKNTSKPGRDPTSRAVLDILTGAPDDVPQQVPPSSGNQQQKSAAPQMPVLKKAPLPQQTVMPSSQQQQQAKLQSMKQVRGVSPPHQPPPPPPPPAVVAPPEVCLRWNSYHSNMQATFPNLLTNEQFVDVTLACEGRSIKCHKVILSACSAYFEELLSANPCQHPIVLMKDLRYWEVQALVDFMYRGEVNVGQDKLPSLLAAAEALQIKGLAGPASTSSSHDEDSLPPPMTPSSLEDFLDESVPSPSSARRARKRRMMSAMQSQTQQSPQSSSMAPLRLRQQQRSSAPVPSTSGYRHESTPDEPPPLRRARRSEAPMEIKIEPIDIDESNDSITDADEVYDGKKFNTVPQHDGHDNGQNLSPEQKSHLDVSNQNDFSGPSSSNNMLSHSDLHSYPFEPGSIKDSANKRISDAGYVDDPMNPAASCSDHNVLAESGGSEESILGHV